MKKIYFIIWLSAQAIFVQAQLSVGTAGITVLSGTTFSTDGLELVPSANVTLATNKITLTSSTVNGTPRPSIQRVYVIDSTIMYNGMIRIHYKPGELNGNTESALSLHYSYHGNWLVLPGTVDAVNDYVSYTTPSALSFSQLTAAETMSALPLMANSFTGALKTTNVLLEWKVSNNNLYKGFQLEKANNSGQWTVVGYIQSLSSAMDDQSYSFSDNDLNFDKRIYRLRLDLKSGGESYSNIISVLNNAINDKVSIVSAIGGIDIHFMDKLPKQVNLFGPSGQLIYKSQQSTANYHITVPIGIYQLQYSIDGVVRARQVISR